MKRNSCLLSGGFAAALLLLAASPAVAQNAKPPTQLTYQGFLTDANGLPFGSTTPVNKTVIFRIYDALTGGSLKWSSQQVITVDKGYFSALLGQGSAVGSEPFNADLTGVFTGAGVSDRYLELNADGTTIAPRLRFLPAPYAMLAKGATELLDPQTGASSLSVSSGNLSLGGNLTVGGNFTIGGTASGNGSLLTSLNAGQITSGTLANGRTTATSANTANAIVGRDSNGSFSANRVTATDFSGSGALLTSLDAGAISSGTLANGRTTATSANTANAIVARDGSGNLTAGQVIANSFKINGTTTYVLYSITRGNLTSSAPTTGVTQSYIANGDTSTRQSSIPTDWYKSTSSYGATAYTATYSVPTGEVWEASYVCNYYWGTDDNGSIVWSLDDVATDDAVTTFWSVPQGPNMFNETFIISAGTHVVRVKAVITGGSGGDHIYFPWHMPSHCVVKKYKVN